MKHKPIISLVALLLGSTLCSAGEYDALFGWNRSAAPKSIAVCRSTTDIAESMMLASLSGLASQATLDGRFDEMVWNDVDHPISYKMLYQNVVDILAPDRIRRCDVWQLLDDYRRQGIVKGYVLYRADSSEGRFYSRRENIDLSVNVATVYAGLLQGVLVEESLEPKMRKLGLRRLKDCRKITPTECFERLHKELNNRSAVSVDPKSANCREYAIANRLMVYYDVTPLSERILEWLQPLSPIVGWNCPDELSHTSMVSRWGHFNTASDWCENITLLSAASTLTEPLKNREILPDQIDFDHDVAHHAYLLSDGDNMQWSYGAFLTDDDFFANGHKSEFGINWTSCPINLSIMATPVWNTIVRAKPTVNSIVEYGGGYQYPDLFAVERPNRPKLLREFARRLNEQMTRLGVTILGVICIDVDSEASREAFKVYAEEIENLTGIIAIQYYPYELDGNIMWFDNGSSVDIPVVTAKYSIWQTVDPNRPRGGSPEFVSSLINRNELSAGQQNAERELAFTVVHAWSLFDSSNSATKTPLRGANAAYSSSTQLVDSIETCSMEELLWRIRMRYRTQQTKQLLNIK
ncbi:MAG: GxGYxYP family putative glycoside hydrolase [Tidjanibacter sp.]|nr:GxGYxYP family putative glycoside hydrolase [Tidjanibacter sp.]